MLNLINKYLPNYIINIIFQYFHISELKYYLQKRIFKEDNFDIIIEENIIINEEFLDEYVAYLKKCGLTFCSYQYIRAYLCESPNHNLLKFNEKEDFFDKYIIKDCYKNN